MGRKRTIDRESVLDAAQCVVQRDGVARLTLDAVAAEAGISKASVLYDYKSKPALMRALVERKIAAEEARVGAIRDALGDTPDVAVRTRIAAASDPATEDDQAFTLCLAAAMAQDSDLRQPICSTVGGAISEIRETSKNPNGALLAFLALEGLKLMEYFGVHRFDPEHRKELVEEIGWLVEQSPGRVPLVAPKKVA
ncbi:TetR/AcrR family transcriptional regulator [Amorphus coralli]|uniref:TetR/AcrR family transcriptional regulator n=1 Tax=Amorphus coralli TaxID=340680 RepID=UPI00036F5148|nr:TetR/AcrR family transcriptional regulator [Amorphus coralli]